MTAMSREDEERILSKQYDLIDTKRDNVPLAQYLGDKTRLTTYNQSKRIYYPFGCNASQKAAVEAACKNLAIELYEKKIRINTVVLGGVNTEMVKNVTNIVPAAKTEVDDWSRVRQLMPIAEVSDVMGAIMFLLGQDSRYITGRKIFVDGGIL